MDDEHRRAVRQFICDNFIVEDGAFGDDDSLLAAKILDSTGILELVSFIEERFDVRVADQEVLPANLDSVSRITVFVRQKQESGVPTPGL